MSAPTAPTQQIQYTVEVKCNSCGKQLHNAVVLSEHEARQEMAKAITIAEVHDCHSVPK